MITNDHVSPEQISAYIDRQLSLEHTQEVKQHLAVCHACALRVLSETELKNATAAAGKRFIASSATLARLIAQIQASGPRPAAKASRLPVVRAIAWMALAACLLFAVGLNVWQHRRETNTLSAELLDQHLATLSSAAAPQVISTDRHTVKPWFQGKLPFSFDLPEPTALPANTTLKGADFTYLHGEPAALLLFAIRSHEVSVFLTKRSNSKIPITDGMYSGFTIRSATTSELRLVGVSNVNPAELDLLMSTLVRAQDRRSLN